MPRRRIEESEDEDPAAEQASQDSEATEPEIDELPRGKKRQRSQDESEQAGDLRIDTDGYLRLYCSLGVPNNTADTWKARLSASNCRILSRTMPCRSFLARIST